MPKKLSDRTWAMLCHLSGLFGFAIPFGNIVAPLVIWLVKRDQSAYINQQGKEAVNFQITMTLAACVAFLLMIVVIGIFLLPIIGLIDLILIVLASIAAYKGENFRYPFAFRFVK